MVYNPLNNQCMCMICGYDEMGLPEHVRNVSNDVRIVFLRKDMTALSHPKWFYRRVEFHWQSNVIHFLFAIWTIGVRIVFSESQVSFVFVSGNSLSSTVLLLRTRVAFPRSDNIRAFQPLVGELSTRCYNKGNGGEVWMVRVPSDSDDE